MTGVIGFVMSSVMTVQLSRAQSQISAQQPAFEVASVRLVPPNDRGYTSFSASGTNHFVARNATLELLIEMAFDVDSYQISSKPSWLDSEMYDVSAKPKGDAMLTSEQTKPLLQQLLRQRFDLEFHRETKILPGYALVIAKGGPKLQASKLPSEQGHAEILSDGLQGWNISLQQLAAMLKHSFRGSPVVDKTGLKGNYDIKLDYAPNDLSDSSLPSIFTALREELGLSLEKDKLPVEMFVIDHVGRVPTEN